MRIRIDREAFATAFQCVASATPKRSTRPILEHVKVAANSKETTLVGTDQEIGISYRCLGVKVERGGDAVLPRERINAIIKTERSSELRIDLDGTNLYVFGQDSRYKIPTMDASLFPVMDDWTAKDFHVIAASDLRRAIRLTVHAHEPESTRFALGGCAFDLGRDSEGEGHVVATDGRRLAACRVSLETEGEPTRNAVAVVPAKTCKILEKMIQDDDPPIHVAIDATKAAFRLDSALVWTRLAEGTFPRWRNLISSGPFTGTATVNARLLRESLERASVTASNVSRCVDFTFSDGVLRLESRTENGESHVETPIRWTGSTRVEVRLDPSYLSDAVRELPPESDVTIDVVDGSAPLRIVFGDYYQSVVMPISRDRSRDDG